jgi:hypothetical protein
MQVVAEDGSHMMGEGGTGSNTAKCETGGTRHMSRIVAPVFLSWSCRDRLINFIISGFHSDSLSSTVSTGCSGHVGAGRSTGTEVLSLATCVSRGSNSASIYIPDVDISFARTKG